MDASQIITIGILLPRSSLFSPAAVVRLAHLAGVASVLEAGGEPAIAGPRDQIHAFVGELAASVEGVKVVEIRAASEWLALQGATS